MGVDYKAYAGIGLRVRPDKLCKPVRVKAFEHSFPENLNFDPKTGKKLWYDRNLYLSDKGAFELEDRPESIFGFPVLWSTDNHEAVICAVASGRKTYSNGGEHVERADLPVALDAQIDKFRQAMEEHGLWNPKEFGLWAVLYCSY